ncbi:hypothetical protein OOU_Y34scaffold00478g5 [Pyricularia oryzae Y34]|uniref:Uncharacterized protein n=2 Tax=Pyricularia oryzae TaxID=318829 RepID=A0AA97P0S7_PYRO3|nr:hypothetical protein OOU_Y34scaffold00478g5 [Pyricularia oryzae Y34]
MLLPSQTSTVVSLLSLVPFMAASGGGLGASRCPNGSKLWSPGRPSIVLARDPWRLQDQDFPGDAEADGGQAGSKSRVYAGLDLGLQPDVPEHEKRQGGYEELAKQVQRTVDMEGASLLPRRGLLTRTSWPVGFPIPVLGGDISIDPSICYWLPVRRQVDKGDEYEFFPAVPGAGRKRSTLGTKDMQVGQGNFRDATGFRGITNPGCALNSGPG